MSELDKAISHLREEYEKACRSQFVQFPLAYALYQTWKWADRQARK